MFCGLEMPAKGDYVSASGSDVFLVDVCIR